MALPSSAAFLIILLTAGLGLVAAWEAWRRRSPGKEPLTLLLAFMAVVALSQLLPYLPTGHERLPYQAAFHLTFWARSVSPVLFWFLALAMGQPVRLLRRSEQLLLAAYPLIVLLLQLTTHNHHLLWADLTVDSGQVFVSQPGYAYAAVGLLSLSLLLVAAYRIAWPAFRSSYLPRPVAWLLTLAALLPWAEQLLYLAGFRPFPALDLAPTAFAVAGLILALNLHRFQAPGPAPLNRERLLDGLQDIFIVIDAAGRVSDLNETACTVLNIKLSQAVGRPAEEVFDSWPTLLRTITALQQGNTLPTLLNDIQGRSYDARFTGISSASSGIAGWIIILRDVTEIRRLEVALRASEELYRSVTEQASEGILIVQGSQIKYCNPRFAEMVATSPSQIIGQSFYDFLTPEQADLVRLRYSLRSRGDTKAYRYESALQPRSASPGEHLPSLPVEFSTSIMGYASPLGYATASSLAAFGSNQTEIMLVSDISERKEAEANLARLAAMIDQANETMVITDLDGHIIYTNPYFEVATGYTVDEALGQKPNMLKSGLQNQEFYADLWQTISSGRTWRGVFINRRKDGSLYHESASIFPIFGPSGKISNYGTVKRDISQQVQAENALRSSEEKLRSIIENSSDAIQLIDHQGLVIEWNPASERITRIPREQALGQCYWDLIELFSGATQDRRQDIARLQQSQVSGQLPEDLHTLEIRMHAPDGLPLDIQATLFIVPSAKGNQLGVILHDITARKQAEEEARTAARNQALLNDITRAAIEQTDVTTMIQLLADRLGELLQGDGCFIMLWDNTSQRVVPAAAYGPMRQAYLDLSLPAGSEADLAGSVLNADRPIAISDIHRTPYLPPDLAAQFPTCSLLGLPLIVSGEKLGTALISFDQPHTFTPTEIALGEQASRQIALAISKVRLLEAERHQRQLAETLQRVGSLLSASLDLTTILDQLLGLVFDVVPFDAAVLFELQNTHAVVIRSTGHAALGMNLPERIPLAQIPHLQQVIETAQPLVISNMRQSSYPGWPPQTGSWVGAPILFEGQVIALFSLESCQPGFFEPEHARRLEAFAGQAALALKNAQFFSQIQQLARIDPLTGIFNRRSFFDAAEKELDRACRYQHPIAVIMLDIDLFKQVNDTYGHHIGDQVLHAVAQTCHSSLRSTDIIGRYGGEEFIIILVETPPEGAVVTAERLRKCIDQKVFQTPAGPIHLTISVGISSITACSLEMHTADQILANLINYADQALYASKANGRNLLTHITI